MNKFLKSYHYCIYCGSKKLEKAKEQNFPINFYLRAIKSDLKLSQKLLKKIKVYNCKNCYLIQNNPWFSENISKKIYSNIYGQHNRGWTNLINFLKKNKLPNHGNLFNYLNNKIKIKNYAEFNSPFMGILLNFFSQEYKNNKKFYFEIFKNIFGYFTSRQVAGKLRNTQRLSFYKSKNFLNKIEKLKFKNLIKTKINKKLLVDNSNLCWGQNDNYKSVNSKSFASQLLDLDVLNLNHKDNKLKFDLFGIFHTLDHTFQPKKVLDYALKSSKYVVVYCHINPKLEKQHLFSFSKKFLLHLNKKKIYTIDLTDIINKKNIKHEMYFLCSKNKKYINKIENKL